MEIVTSDVSEPHPGRPKQSTNRGRRSGISNTVAHRSCSLVDMFLMEIVESIFECDVGDDRTCGCPRWEHANLTPKAIVDDLSM
ncbi:hypothetical protein MUK42_35162 [Musa troglodytarum]|uniref:Uncharacterized protein n=1 Tax=Musa troglodytarum TaxID=320322 RepID=A0A9E7HCK8_9LILI|nr:hypothetical protein MUK42_35162 [Musa troglodytarum]